jgi:hypothetical protein
MCFILCIYRAGLISRHTSLPTLMITSFYELIYNIQYYWIVLHFKDIDHNRSTVRTLHMLMQFSKHVILNAIWFSRNWYSKTLGNSKRLDMPFRQSVSKVLGQMPQNLWISTNVNPPAPCSMLCPISRHRFDVFWLEQQFIGVGEGEVEGSGIV